MAASVSPAAADREGLRRPPRFVVRVLLASFTTVVLVLISVIALLGYQARQAVEVRVREELEAGHRLVAMAQAERQRNATVQATVLTQSDALANAFEQFRAGRKLAGDDQRLTALEWELRSIEALLDADVVGVADETGRVLCASGRYTSAWTNERLLLDGDAPGPFEAFVTAHDQPFAVTAAPIRVRGGRIGHLVVGTALDQRHLERLAHLAHSGVAIVIDGRVFDSALTPRDAAFRAAVGKGLLGSGLLDVKGEVFAYRRIRQVGPASFYAIDSVTQKVRGLTEAALPKLIGIIVASLGLCLLASFRLARSVSAPMIACRERWRRWPTSRWRHGCRRRGRRAVKRRLRLVLQPPVAVAVVGPGRDGRRRGRRDPRARRRARRAGCLHRRPLRAGQRHLGRDRTADADLRQRDRSAAPRRAAARHREDRHKRNILGKAGALTDEEYGIIKSHPVLGAQILRTVAFLEPHLPIVELHHEQPDGLGYPHGLKGDQVPLLARIVHVADAFDAMTTARAYRAGRPASEALAVLWRFAGTQFDLAPSAACRPRSRSSSTACPSGKSAPPPKSSRSGGRPDPAGPHALLPATSLDCNVMMESCRGRRDGRVRTGPSPA